MRGLPATGLSAGGKVAGQKLPALAEAFLIDAVADARRDVPLGWDVERSEPLRGVEQRLHRDEFIPIAVDE